MKPADIILLIRQRSEWEAVDLGFSLVQYTWRNIFPAWILLILSFSAVCILLMPEDYIWVAGVLLWWIKPLFDRVLLHILSRSLFAQTLSIADVFSALPYLIKNTGLLGALTWRRFSFSRSYNLPIWQLEQLRGKSRKERHELLYHQGHSQAVGLTICCILLQVIIATSIFALIILFDPTGQVWEHLEGLFSGTSGSDMEYLLSLGDYTTQLIALIIIEPFFVAGGFALYLNRRTQLEAWDIEITFRSMGDRLTELANKAAKPALVLFGCGLLIALSVFSHPGVQAAETEVLSPERLPVSEAPTQLEKVMEADELSERRQISTWVPRDKSKKSDELQIAEGIVQLVSAFLKFILWAVVLIMLLLAFVYREKIIALLKPPKAKAKQIEKPEVLFGMDVRPESLPKDIAGQAQQLWQAGKQREALSLLYRGALMHLTHYDEVDIQDNHTEGDILQLARKNLTEERFHYLKNITRRWQTIAYAHRTPNNSDMQPLFEGWQTFQAISAEPEIMETKP